MLIYPGVWLGIALTALGAALTQNIMTLVGLLITAATAIALRPASKHPAPAVEALGESRHELPQADVPALLHAIVPSWNESIGQSRDLLQSNISDLLRRFGNIAFHLEGSPNSPEQIVGNDGAGTSLQRDLQAIMVGLQFQDRVDQMLDHVQIDQRKLLDALQHQDSSLNDPQAWLGHLRQRFTTEEERLGKRQAADSEVTFF